MSEPVLDEEELDDVNIKVKLMTERERIEAEMSSEFQSTDVASHTDSSITTDEPEMNSLRLWFLYSQFRALVILLNFYQIFLTF